MIENKKILILYSEFGMGHKTCAKYLANKLDGQVYIHNAKQEQNPFMTKFIEKGYNDFFTKNAHNKIISNTYGFLFWIVHKSNFLIKNCVQKTGAKSVHKLIKKYNPDIIVCAYPYKIKTNIPILMMVTDYDIAPSWICNEGEHYLISSEKIKKTLINKNIEEEKIFYTGIPIDDKFYNEENNESVKNILFNLGARGQFKLKNIISNIDNLKKYDFNITIICGKNEKLFNKLNKLYENKKNITIYPYVNNIEQIIKDNDIVITKAGGISISENIVAQKPMIINKTQSLKGQEHYNINFVKDNNLGLISDEKDIYKTILKYYNDNKLYKNTINNLKEQKEKYNEQNVNTIINNILF